MTKERLHYIDVAKGLLIIMVVWGHYELMCRLCFKVNNPTIDRLNSVETLWVSFFMPAFFFLTGFCTNFSKRFTPFFVQGVKLLLIPTIIINHFANIIEYWTWGESPLWIVKTSVKSFLLTCAGEWFIPSMLLSRLAVWGLSKINHQVWQIVIALCSFCVGVILSGLLSLQEIWYYKHAMMMVIFMLVGKLMKINNLQIGECMQWIYIPLLAIFLLTGTDIPYITNRVSVSLWQIPIVLVLALTGTFFVLSLSRRIGQNRLLEYLGRNSLIIYLAHFIFYQIYLSLVKEWFEISSLISGVLFFGVIIANIASCSLLARILNTKYLKWILGKF